MDGGSAHRLGRCLVFRMAGQRAADRKAIPPSPKTQTSFALRAFMGVRKTEAPSVAYAAIGIGAERSRARLFVAYAVIGQIRLSPTGKRAGRRESILFHAGKRADFLLIAFFFELPGPFMLCGNRLWAHHLPKRPKAAFPKIREGPLSAASGCALSFQEKQAPFFRRHGEAQAVPLRYSAVQKRLSDASDGGAAKSPIEKKAGKKAPFPMAGTGMSGKTPLSAIRAWRSAGEDRWKMCPCLCAWSRTRRCRHVATPCRSYRIPKDKTPRLCWPHRKTTFPHR